MTKIVGIRYASRLLGLTIGSTVKLLQDAPPGVCLVVDELTKIDLEAFQAWLNSLEPRPQQDQQLQAGAR